MLVSTLKWCCEEEVGPRWFQYTKKKVETFNKIYSFDLTVNDIVVYYKGVWPVIGVNSFTDNVIEKFLKWLSR